MTHVVLLGVQEHVIITQMYVTSAFLGYMAIYVTNSVLLGVLQCVIGMVHVIPVILGGTRKNVIGPVLLDVQVHVIRELVVVMLVVQDGMETNVTSLALPGVQVHVSRTQADVILVIWDGIGTTVIKPVVPDVHLVTV